MKTFYFSGSQAKFSPYNESLALRTGFLLADVAIITLYTQFLLDVERLFNERSKAEKQKVVLEYFAVKEPEKTATVRQYAQLAKKVGAQKRRNAQDLVLLNKFEQLMDSYFNSYILHFKRDLEPYGVTELTPLLDHKALGGFYYSDATPEKTPIEGDVRLSELLQMLAEGDEQDNNTVEDVLFTIPMEFLLAEFYPTGMGSIAETLPPDAPPAADEEAVWIELLFELPNVSVLTVEELLAVRNELSAPGSAFRGAVDTWIADCRHKRRTVRERARFFEETLRPAARILQEATTQNKILTAYLLNQKAGRPRVSIYAAEMPLHALWAFYEKCGVLPEPTLQKLRTVWDTRGTQRFPMMVVGPSGFYPPTEENQPAEKMEEAFQNLPLSVRKSIAL